MTAQYKEGAYRCEIVDQGLSQSTNNNPQFWLRIQPREVLFVDGELLGSERTVYWTLTDKTIDFVVEKLKALGFTGNSFRQLDPNHAQPESFVGQLEDFYCKHESYNGEWRERWDLSRGAYEVKPLDDSAARKLDAMYGKKLTNGKPAAAPAKKAKPATAEHLEPATHDADIPF